MEHPHTTRIIDMMIKEGGTREERGDDTSYWIYGKREREWNTTSFPWLCPSLSISCSNEWIEGRALKIGTRIPRKRARMIVLNENENERERWRRRER